MKQDAPVAGETATTELVPATAPNEQLDGQEGGALDAGTRAGMLLAAAAVAAVSLPYQLAMAALSTPGVRQPPSTELGPLIQRGPASLSWCCSGSTF